ncbi:hypothetical protein ACFV2X_09510 [Streptomyces sp. NPDC059679]|uniref:hypothetical protein n=1 Tax=Streptomyces sp. NPDC059679 TaxID=3346903 RepID=UPI0036AB85E9
MGERPSDDGVPGRRVHPSGAASEPRDVRGDPALETALASVIRGDDLDPEAEQRAVAAFRAARSAGAHRARTRRRDDWRPPAERRTGRPVKTTFGVVFASLALGGVAVAAIGSGGSSAGGAHREAPHPSAVAPDRSAASSASSGGAGPTKRPAASQDTEAHCRAYERVEDRGKALDATAWQRLVAVAGGKDKVAAYCSEQLARATTEPTRPDNTGKPSAGAADPGKGTAGNTGASGNEHSDAGNPPEKSGRASGDKGNGKHE